MKHVTTGRYGAITARRGAALIAALVLGGGLALGHIVPPEELDPIAESYRRLCFLLRLNPVPWENVARDADVVGRGLRTVDAQAGDRYVAQVNVVLDAMKVSGEEAPGPSERRAASRALFERSTRAAARALRARLGAASAALDRHAEATAALEADERQPAGQDRQPERDEPEEQNRRESG